MAETVDKRGQTAELSYTLRFTAENDLTVIAWEDMRVLEADGQPVPAVQQDAVSIAFRLPSLVVDDTASVVDIRGMDELLESFATLDPRFADVASSSGFASAIEESVVSKYWYVWFQLWADWVQFENPVEEGTFDDGSGSPQTVVMTSLGSTADGWVALRRSSSITGDALDAALEGLFSSIGAPDDDILSGADGRIDDVAEVVTDPSALWPRSVLYERTMVLTVDGETQEQSERRLSTLDWDASDCQ